MRWVVVQVRTDAGLVGIGETWYTPGVLDAVKAIGSVVRGSDPRDVSRIWSWLSVGMQSPDDGGHVDIEWTALVSRFGLAGGWVDDGPLMYAISGLEVALCDLKGRMLGAPVYDLIGGQFRREIRLYADLHGDPTKSPEEEWPARAVAATDLGYDAIKFDVDLAFPENHRDPWNRSLSRREVERTASTVHAIRDAIGPDVDLALDCHWQFNAVDAARLAARVEDIDLLWLEDPLPMGNVEVLARLAATTKVPIALGEVLWTTSRFLPLLVSGACQIAHPDICTAGGILATKRIGDLCDDFSVPLALHNSGGPVALAASAHVAAATKSFLALEFHNIDVPWWLDIINPTGFEFQHGRVTIDPTCVGLGLDLNEQGCREHVDGWESLF
jgi:L-alanine-DL-glutamate epimerase-like enolase superfamily enzyme